MKEYPVSNKDKKWYINSPKHSNDFKAFIKDEKVRHAYSIVEISELLDLPTYAIYDIRAQAIKKMKKMLEEKETDLK